MAHHVAHCRLEEVAGRFVAVSQCAQFLVPEDPAIERLKEDRTLRSLLVMLVLACHCCTLRSKHDKQERTE